MKRLSPALVTEINRLMIDTYSKGELVGVKEPTLLDSAVHRPFQTMYGEALYPDVFEKATALFESLAKNHVFHNGNKRSALASVMYFLFINGQVCIISESEAVELTVGFVVGEHSFEDVVSILQANSYQKTAKA